jgi:hypothetical protein
MERAKLLIEQARALGEPIEDPLLLLSVLYAFWVANYVSFNGNAVRELAGEFLKLAKKEETLVHSSWDIASWAFPCWLPATSPQAERNSRARSNSTIQRASFIGGAIQPGQPGSGCVLSIMGSAVPWLS